MTRLDAVDRRGDLLQGHAPAGFVEDRVPLPEEVLQKGRKLRLAVKVPGPGAALFRRAGQELRRVGP